MPKSKQIMEKKNSKNFKNLNCSSKIKSINVLSYSRIHQRLINSWQYHFQMNSFLAKTHIMTDVEFAHKADPNRRSIYSSVKWADLDPVEYKYMLLANINKSICIYDVSKTHAVKSISEIGHVSDAHQSLVSCVQWYPLDAGIFASSSVEERSVKIWDPNTMKLVDQFELASTVNHHHMSPVASKHSLIAAALNNGDINLCDLRTGSYTHSLSGKNGHRNSVHSVQWSKHNQYLLSSGGENTLRMWDVRSGKSCLKVINYSALNATRTRDNKKVLPHNPSIICSLCYTHDGLWLISNSVDGCISFWDAMSFKLHKKKKVRLGYSYLGFEHPIKLAVTHNLYPDLVFAADGKLVSVVEVPSGKILNHLDPQFSGVLGAVYNPVSGDLYTYGMNMNVIVWMPDMLAPKLVENEDSDINTKKLTSDNWSDEDDA